MKHFKNSNILFKLIISFILCCLVFSGIFNYNVSAKCNNEHKEEVEGYPITTTRRCGCKWCSVSNSNAQIYRWLYNDRRVWF